MDKYKLTITRDLNRCTRVFEIERSNREILQVTKKPNLYIIDGACAQTIINELSNRL
jgi:hypothetical protein